jgi:quercetin dioxygenase-like cupin family protein
MTRKAAAFLIVAVVTAGGVIQLLARQQMPDDVAANPTQVKVLLENDKVRVIDIIVKPGEKQVMHAHPAYVSYVVAGGTMKSHLADGSITDMMLTAGQTLYREPLTHWSENVGRTTVHLVDVELKGK